MYFKTLIVLVVVVMIFDSECRNVNEDIDNVIDMLLNGDDLEPATSVKDQEGEQPFFSEGIWKCGNCDVIDDSKIIYSEINDVEINNISNEELATVQVALGLENMQCITVTSGRQSKVIREAGECRGEEVTLAVVGSDHFVITVYGH